MSALFVRPVPFVAASTSPAPVAGGVDRLALDRPNLVWRGNLTSYMILDLGTGTLAYDTVAIVGANLRATDTVQVRTGTTTTGTGGYAGTATPAWMGTKPEEASAITVIQLGSVRNQRYVRIDFVATGNPAGFVEVQRVVIGKGVRSLGVSTGADLIFEDQSTIESGPNYRSVDERDVFTAWKISIGFIDSDVWRNEWVPLLQWAGSRRAILFVVDDQQIYQHEVIFGCITSKAAGKAEYSNTWRFDATITSLAR